MQPTHAHPECYIAMRMRASRAGRIEVYSASKTTEYDKNSGVTLGEGFDRYCVATVCLMSAQDAIEVYYEPSSTDFTRCTNAWPYKKYLVRYGAPTYFQSRNDCEKRVSSNLINGSCS